MTEQEWSMTDDLQVVMESHPLWCKVSERKHWLFGVACCRRIQHLCPLKAVWQALDVAERYADGRASEVELQDAAGVIERYRTSLAAEEQDTAKDWAAAAVQVCITQRDYRLAGEAAYHSSMAASAAVGVAPVSPTEEQAQCHLFRDILGNPFRRVTVDPSWQAWNHGAVVKIAQSIYDERAFNQLPTLADALEEAGCTNADILAHCRQPGEHVRGCWVVDLVLGKE